MCNSIGISRPLSNFPFRVLSHILSSNRGEAISNDDFSARVAAIRMQGPRILPSVRWSSLYSTHGLDTDEKTARDVLEELHALLTWMREEGQTPRAVEKKFRQKFFDNEWARAFHTLNPYGDDYTFYYNMVSPSLERLCHIEEATYYAFEDWERLVELAEDRPYWRYVALVDNRTHPAHKSLTPPPKRGPLKSS